jgi:hypothetical protein
MFHKLFIYGRKRLLEKGAGWLTLVSIIIEMKCPKHGLERFTVKIIKRFNIASHEIMPRLRTKTVRGELSLLYVGRNVSYDEAKGYVINYFRERGMLEQIVRMRMLF